MIYILFMYLFSNHYLSTDNIDNNSSQNVIIGVWYWDGCICWVNGYKKKNHQTFLTHIL